MLANGVKARLQELDSIAWGMDAAVQCQEEFLLVSPDEQAVVAAVVRPGFDGIALRFPESSSAMPAWCATAGFGPRPAYENEPVQSETCPCWLSRIVSAFLAEPMRAPDQSCVTP